MKGNTLQWAPTEVFEISGLELETLMGMLQAKLANADAQRIIREYETFKTLQSKVQEGIIDGKVKLVDTSDDNS